MKKIVLLSLLLVVCINIVFAFEIVNVSEQFNDLNIVELSSNGNVIKNVFPNSTIDVWVYFNNSYNETIKDIYISADLNDVKDYDKQINKILPNETKHQKFSFRIPYGIDDEEHDLNIKLRGKLNGTLITDSEKIEVYFEKLNHEILVVDNYFEKKTVRCGEDDNYFITLWNTGLNDEEVNFSFYNSNLNFEFKRSLVIPLEDSVELKIPLVFDNIKNNSYAFWYAIDGGVKIRGYDVLKIKYCNVDDATPVVNELNKTTIQENNTTNDVVEVVDKLSVINNNDISLSNLTQEEYNLDNTFNNTFIWFGIYLLILLLLLLLILRKRKLY